MIKTLNGDLTLTNQLKKKYKTLFKQLRWIIVFKAKKLSVY